MMIRAVFNEKEDFLKVYGLTQWDYGQQLQIIGVAAKHPEVHFAGANCADALICPAAVQEDGSIVARIPDRLLERGEHIKAYVYDADGSSGETLCTMTLRVEKRTKPKGYDAPGEKNLLRQIMEELEGKADGIRYEDDTLKLLSGETEIARVTITGGSGGGADAREVELQNDGTYIQWRHAGDAEWNILVALSDITGAPGQDGHTPVKGVDYFTEEDTAAIAEEAARLVDAEIPDIESLDAEKVFFGSDLTTTHAIGNIALSNGQATIPAAGKNLKEVWDAIFVQEKDPVTTQPSVSLSVPQAKAYEVGTKVIPTYTAAFDPGSYTYGPPTGVTVTAWEVTDTAGNTAADASGSFPEVQVTPGSNYKITAKATYGDGTVPVTNIGNPYAAGQIKAGNKSAASSVAVTGYRNSFYGTLTEKSDLASDVIRSLTKSGKALADGSSFTVPVPVGALRVVIAYPDLLRDITSIKDVNGMNAEISSGFAKQVVLVNGENGYDAIGYKVYTMDFASPNDTANSLAVTI